MRKTGLVGVTRCLPHDPGLRFLIKNPARFHDDRMHPVATPVAVVGDLASAAGASVQLRGVSVQTWVLEPSSLGNYEIMLLGNYNSAVITLRGLGGL